MSASELPSVRQAVWSSRFSFLYSASAAAIGLGSLWRFPYVAGSNGGGAFVLLYIGFVILLCIPIILAEMVIGKRGHGSTVGSVNHLVKEEKASSAWRTIGWLSLLIPFFGLSYYSVIAGWGIEYARLAVFDSFSDISVAESKATFDALISSPLTLMLLQFIFIAAVVWVVARGLQRGIEWVSRIKMTVMFGVLIFMVIYNAATVGLGSSIDFLFRPDFSQLTGQAVLTAFGQALFSTGIGIGVLMTYSSYVPKDISLPQSSALLAIAVIFVATMAGLAIFPTVFHYGLEPAEGPNLIFVTVPVAFGQMTGGWIVSILFFGLIAIGAFTSAVGMLEPIVSWLQERAKKGRALMAIWAGLGVWIVGFPSLLSFNVLADARPLSAIPIFANSNFFDILDMGIANVLLPLNALLIALFVGWAMRRTVTEEEFGGRGVFYTLWITILKFLSPLAILGLMVNS